MTVAPPAPAPAPAPAPTGTSRRTLLLSFRTSAVGTVVTYGVNLAIVPFVLHRVGADLYGAWATMASILAVGALADAGVRTEIVRRVGAAQGEGDEAGLVRSVHEGVTMLVALAGTIALIGAVAAPAIRAFAFPGGVPGYSPPEVDLLLRGTTAVLAASLVLNGYFGVLRGLQRGDVETTGMMVAVPVSAAVTVTGVALGWGLWALFLGSLATLAVTATWSWVGTRRLVPSLRLRLVALRGPVLKGYLAFSGLALLSQISDVVDSQWDKVVLSHFVGSKAVASFQIGTTLVLQGKTLALLPLAPLLVAIAELRRRDRARMEALFHLMATGAMVLAAVVLGAIVVFGPAFIRLWLGNDAAGAAAARAAQLFAVAAALNLLSAPLAFRAFGEGWHRLAAVGSGTNMVVNGALSILLTVAVGFTGALIGSIAGNLAGTAVFFVLMRRRMGESWTAPPWRALLVGVAAAAAGLASGIGRTTSWAVLAVVAGSYIAVVGLACARVERLRLGDLLSRRHPVAAA